MGYHYGISDYGMLVAARESLRRKISSDWSQPDHTAVPDHGPLSNPERLLRVYGMIAKLDEEISRLEDMSFGTWRQNESGVM